MAALGEDLLHVVNKLQDLVFNTIGNDSLDLPQIVRWQLATGTQKLHTDLARLSSDRNPPESHLFSRTLSEGIFYLVEAASSREDR